MNPPPPKKKIISLPIPPTHTSQEPDPLFQIRFQIPGSLFTLNPEPDSQFSLYTCFSSALNLRTPPYSVYGAFDIGV